MRTPIALALAAGGAPPDLRYALLGFLALAGLLLAVFALVAVGYNAKVRSRTAAPILPTLRPAGARGGAAGHGGADPLAHAGAANDGDAGRGDGDGGDGGGDD